MLEIKKQWKKRLYRIGFVAAIVYTFLSSNIYMLITVLAHICMKYKNDIWKRKEPIQYGLLDKFWMVYGFFIVVLIAAGALGLLMQLIR